MDTGFIPVGLDMPYRVFIGEDPIRLWSGDINFYMYVKNKPLRFKDPSGLACGSGWNEPIVPDDWGEWDYTTPCEHHDKCYGSCG